MEIGRREADGKLFLRDGNGARPSGRFNGRIDWSVGNFFARAGLRGLKRRERRDPHGGRTDYILGREPGTLCRANFQLSLRDEATANRFILSSSWR